MDDVPVTLLATQLGLELLSRINLSLGGRGCEDVCLVGVGVLLFFGVSVSFVVGYICIIVGVSFGVSVSFVVGIGCSRLNLRLFNGLSRRACCAVRGPIQLSLSYLELLLRHLVSCFLIA